MSSVKSVIYVYICIHTSASALGMPWFARKGRMRGFSQKPEAIPAHRMYHLGIPDIPADDPQNPA